MRSATRTRDAAAARPRPTDAVGVPVHDVVESVVALDRARGHRGRLGRRWADGGPVVGPLATPGPRAGTATSSAAPAAAVGRWAAFVAALEPLREAGLDEAPAGPAARAASRRPGGEGVRARHRRGVAGRAPWRHRPGRVRPRRPRHVLRPVRGLLRQPVRDLLAPSSRNRSSRRRRRSRPRRPRPGQRPAPAAGARQRGGMKVRALLDSYGDLITQLMPCVLVSPDSVARFFPLGSVTFDLVVFDEASQIRVADAVGAIGRARAVVVVGDSKQMPPTLGEVSGESEARRRGAGQRRDRRRRPGVILTECVSRGLPQPSLTWHYRSRDEALIAFSNGTTTRTSCRPSPARSAAATATRCTFRPRRGPLRPARGPARRRRPARHQPHEAAQSWPRWSDASPRTLRRSGRGGGPGRRGPELPSIGVVTFNQQRTPHRATSCATRGDERIVEALDGRTGEGCS